jgi:stage II sporulation protein D
MMAALLACAPAFATPETLDGVVRVGLETLGSRATFTLESSGPVDVIDLTTSHPVARWSSGAYVLTVRDGAVTCSARSLSSTDGLRFSSPDGKPFKLGDRRYLGALEFWRQGSGLFVVNEVGLEDYVFGSLLSEGAPKMPPEALKALAVAIRTYAEKSLGKHGYYDVCDTTHCQTYVGYRDQASEWAKRAQEATANQILLWNGKPIWSLYSTDSGGATANNEDVMSGPPLPYLRAVSVEDESEKASAADSPYRTWTVKIPVSEAERTLNRRAETRIGHLADVRVAQADAYGRAITLSLEGEPKPSRSQGASKVAAASLHFNSPSPKGDDPNSAKGEESDAPAKTIRAADFRALFGSDRVKSTLFTIKDEGGYLILTGKGYGHGVGMCVLGADQLATEGMDYRAILMRFYTDVSLADYLEPLNDDPFETTPP